MPGEITRWLAGSGGAVERRHNRERNAIQRQTELDVVRAQGRAIVQAARAQAVHYVSDLALCFVEDLTNKEGLAITRTPLGEARYRAIADTATATFAHLVAETGRG